jgi:hypothetical protein
MQVLTHENCDILSKKIDAAFEMLRTHCIKHEIKHPKLHVLFADYMHTDEIEMQIKLEATKRDTNDMLAALSRTAFPIKYGFQVHSDSLTNHQLRGALEKQLSDILQRALICVTRATLIKPSLPLPWITLSTRVEHMMTQQLLNFVFTLNQRDPTEVAENATCSSASTQAASTKDTNEAVEYVVSPTSPTPVVLKSKSANEVPLKGSGSALPNTVNPVHLAKRLQQVFKAKRDAKAMSSLTLEEKDNPTEPVECDAKMLNTYTPSISFRMPLSVLPQSESRVCLAKELQQAFNVVLQECIDKRIADPTVLIETAQLDQSNEVAFHITLSGSETHA